MVVAYLNISGSKWHSNPSNRSCEFTSACFCNTREEQDDQEDILQQHVTVTLFPPTESKTLITYFLNIKYAIRGRRRESPSIFRDKMEPVRVITLSYLCSFLRLANPPKRREEPSTRRRFERTEPKREYFTTWILFWRRANKAIISSVAFPQVAFRSPPTACTCYRVNNPIAVRH